MDDDGISPTADRVIGVVAGLVALVGMGFLGAWLRPQVEPHVAAFVHWLGRLSL